MAKGVKFDQKSAERIARTVLAVEGATLGMLPMASNRRGGGAGFSALFGILSCGFSRIDHAARTVSMNYGLLRHGTQDFTIDAAEVECGGATNIILVRYTRKSVAVYTDPAHTLKTPTDPNFVYFPLFKFEYQASKLRLTEIYHLGALWIPGESP